MRTRRPRPATIPRSAFTGFYFPPDVIVLAVRCRGRRVGLISNGPAPYFAEHGLA
jgi:hypothetical protein